MVWRRAKRAVVVLEVQEEEKQQRHTVGEGVTGAPNAADLLECGVI
jgi:hypothetical protein